MKFVISIRCYHFEQWQYFIFIQNTDFIVPLDNKL